MAALLMVCLASLGGFSSYMLFAEDGIGYRIFELVPLSREFRLELALLVIFNILSSLSFETYATQALALWVGTQLKRLRRWINTSALVGGGSVSVNHHKRDQKLYKLIAESMED